MRKEEIRGIVLYILIIASAVIFGFAFVRPQVTDYGPNHMSPLLFVLLFIGFAYLINVFGLELLHVIGAVIGGYKITRFNVLWLCFYKEKESWKFGIRDFNGLSGETRIAPTREKTNLNWLTWFPLFGYAIELATCIVLGSIAKTSDPKLSWLIPASTIVLLIASMLAVYNFIPVKLDSMTDGYRIRLFSNKINVDAYNKMLVIQEKQRLGEKIDGVPVFDEITEYTAEINVLAINKYIEDGKLLEAEKIVDKLIENKKIINPKDYARMIAQKLYIMILTRDIEEVKKEYDTLCPIEVRRFIANDAELSTIRAYILIAGMIENSQSEVLYSKSRINKVSKKALESEIRTEKELIEKALEYISEKHPKWEKENAAE